MEGDGSGAEGTLPVHLQGRWPSCWWGAGISGEEDKRQRGLNDGDRTVWWNGEFVVRLVSGYQTGLDKRAVLGNKRHATVEKPRDIYAMLPPKVQRHMQQVVSQIPIRENYQSTFSTSLSSYSSLLALNGGLDVEELPINSPFILIGQACPIWWYRGEHGPTLRAQSGGLGRVDGHMGCAWCGWVLPRTPQ